MMIRPSNSGTATWVATSSGVSPSSESAQVARLQVRHSPCRIGMSSAASAATSQSSSSPPAVAVAGRGAAGGEHGDDQRVAGAQVAEQARRRRSRRRSVKIGTPTPAGRRRSRRPARARRRCCPTPGAPGRTASPIFGPGRCGGRQLGARERAPGRQRGRRLEALAGQQHGVATKACSCAQVRRAALGEVAVRLRRRCRSARVDSRISSASGVCSPPSTTIGTLRRGSAGRGLLPGPRGPEDADDDHVRAVDHDRQARCRRRAVEGLASA